MIKCKQDTDPYLIKNEDIQTKYKCTRFQVFALGFTALHYSTQSYG